MYINLLAEMSRKNISRTELSDKTGIKYTTLTDKLNGKTNFTVEEAIKIRKSAFSEFEYEYLFYKSPDMN